MLHDMLAHDKRNFSIYLYIYPILMPFLLMFLILFKLNSTLQKYKYIYVCV